MKYDARTVPVKFEACFYADNDTDADIGTVLHDQDLDRLTLSGYVADSALDVGPVVTREDFRHIDQVLSLCNGICTLLDANSIRWDTGTLGRTLIAGFNYRTERATEKDCDAYLNWLNYAEQENRLPPLLGELDEDSDEDTIKVSRYNEALHCAMRARRFFVTESGSLGLGTRTMAVGDIVTVLHGCGVPVALCSHGEYHTVVGPCYVNGIMYGEAVRKFHEQG
jgi:hypothetical protein